MRMLTERHNGIVLTGLIAIALATDAPIVFSEGVAIGVSGSPRSIIRKDPIEAAFAETGRFDVTNWKPVTAKEGVFSGPPFQSGYVRFTLNLPQEKAFFLEAKGNGAAYVDGAPRAGDPYSFGYLSLPVRLSAGSHEFVFAVGRGSFSARLVPVTAPVSLDLRDTTMPDLLPSDKRPLWGGIIVRNATADVRSDLTLEARANGRTVRTKLPTVSAESVRKVGFQIPTGKDGRVTLRLIQKGKTADEQTVTLRVRKTTESYRRTFISDIDGSVQYYAVQPSLRPGAGQALVLSMHGASVEAQGQAEAYGQKTWANLVAATNRRPYGFDWEDIGRRDAMEVLEHARAQFQPDPTRIYATGHSMGGHGTWQMGSNFPSMFAAIAPSAGWISFNSYTGSPTFPDTAVGRVLTRANSPSDTLSRIDNFLTPEIFVLHGDADDNVPVTEARRMRELLIPKQARLRWKEVPGAGHWWDGSPEPGADAVDDADIWKTFAGARLPQTSDVRKVNFSTADPGISSRSFWVTVNQSTVSFVPSRVVAEAMPQLATFRVTTENVRSLTLDPAPLATQGPVKVEIDGQTVTTTADRLTLQRGATTWRIASPPSTKEKNPNRSGSFKDIFRNRVVFVIGSQGSAEMQDWARKAARFAAETYYYRGNGAVEIIEEKDAPKFKHRNLLVFGQSDLLGDSPVRGGTTAISLNFADGKSIALTGGNTLFMIRPRQGSEIASVATISPTSLAAARSSYRVPLFTSGAGMPDFMVLAADHLQKGIDGVSAAGFFGPTWDLAAGG